MFIVRCAAQFKYHYLLFVFGFPAGLFVIVIVSAFEYFSPVVVTPSFQVSGKGMGNGHGNRV